MTIGLFLFVINGVTLWLAAWIAENVFEVGFVIDGLLPAILGSIMSRPRSLSSSSTMKRAHEFLSHRPARGGTVAEPPDTWWRWRYDMRGGCSRDG
jgi:hypothetical protein